MDRIQWADWLNNTREYFKKYLWLMRKRIYFLYQWFMAFGQNIENLNHKLKKSLRNIFLYFFVLSRINWLTCHEIIIYIEEESERRVIDTSVGVLCSTAILMITKMMSWTSFYANKKRVSNSAAWWFVCGYC